MDNTTQLMGQQHDDARITAMARWLLETVPPWWCAEAARDRRAS